MGLHLHRRQFVIARKAYIVDDQWKSEELPDGFHLSYHEELGITTLGGARFLGSPLLGSNPDGEMSGRFVKLVWPLMQPDASALLSIFYCDTEDGPIVSSSVALIHALQPEMPLDDRELRWGGFNWFPAPRSRINGVRKLLPHQQLSIPALSVVSQQERFPTAADNQDAAGTVSLELTSIVASASSQTGVTYLALTAGLDSRTIAAALVASGVKFEAYTQVVKSKADIEIAQKICRYFGVRHHVIEPVNEPNDDLDLWRRHTLRSYSDAADHLLFPARQFRFLQKGDVILRGGCFEVGRNFFGEKLQGLTFQNASGDEVWGRFEAIPNKNGAGALDDWIKARRNEEQQLSFADQLYHDQRLGGWLASVEQGLDVLPGRSIQPANSRRIMGALLVGSDQDRKRGQVQHMAIAKLEPKLLKFPFNPKDASGYMRSFKRAAKRVVKRFKN